MGFFVSASLMSCDLTKNWYTFQEVLTIFSLKCAFFEGTSFIDEVFGMLRIKIKIRTGMANNENQNYYRHSCQILS